MAKAKKGKLPKRVAGVKIPKPLRKRGEALIAQAQSPAGRAAIAKGAAAVASVVAVAAQAAARAAEPRPGQSGDSDTATRPATPPRPDAVADAIGAGVEAVLGRLFPRR